MKTLEKFLFLILFVYFSGFSTSPELLGKKDARNFQLPRQMHVGEEITYVVKYGLFKLGEVKLQILERKEKNESFFYKTRAYIDSYSGIPFVDLHQIYESDFNSGEFSNYFRHTEREKDYVKFTEYFFDYTNKTVHIKKGKYKPYQIWTDSTTEVNNYCQDGLSLFYYARLNTGIKKSVDVPCFITEKFVSTRINFYDTIDKISIGAVDYDIPCCHLDGYADFVSIFGLTGNFEGWFTNDEHAVPTIAKMKVVIGNVTLELKSWRKKNWNPPKFNS